MALKMHPHAQGRLYPPIHSSSWGCSMLRRLRTISGFFTSIAMGMLTHSARAAEGMAHPWQLDFQPAATPVMEQLTSMHNFLLYIITGVSVFVLGLLVVVCLRFNRKANPVPSKTSHNTLIEIVWTAVPILILLVIAIPSLRLHYFMDVVQEPDMTLKIVGHQWYWEYEYPDQGGVNFESRMKEDKDLAPGEPRLLAVDNPVVVPVNKTVLLHVTGADVIHAWAIPAFGVKIDAVPGRLNEGWFKVTKPGIYYGQCSELCGVDHGFMPIMVKAVPEEEFTRWIEAKKKSASASPSGTLPAL